jgi:hypothetical protein
MEMDWNYVWAALALNFLIVTLVPKLIKKPTGVNVVDDVVLFLTSQKDMLLSSSIVLALVIFGSHYWLSSSSTTPAMSPTVKAFGAK